MHRMGWVGVALGIVGLAVAPTACVISQIEGGVVRDVDGDGELRGALQHFESFALGDGFFVSHSQRGKFGSGLTQLGVGGDVGVMPTSPMPVAPYGRVGLTLLQFEDIADAFVFGALSPYAQAGVMIVPAMFGDTSDKGGFFVSLAGQVDYAVRFSDDHPNRIYWAALVGIGLVFMNVD